MSKYPYKSSHIDYFQIGSHIGNTANDPIYSLEMKNKNIILVEPVPFLYKILKHNYKDRRMMNEIDYLNIAISDYNGYISLFAPSENNDFNKYPFFLNQMASTTDKYIQKFKFNERFPDFKFEKISQDQVFNFQLLFVCCNQIRRHMKIYTLFIFRLNAQV
jgi:FkbM family methyltransferase